MDTTRIPRQRSIARAVPIATDTRCAGTLCILAVGHAGSCLSAPRHVLLAVRS